MCIGNIISIRNYNFLIVMLHQSFQRLIPTKKNFLRAISDIFIKMKLRWRKLYIVSLLNFLYQISKMDKIVIGNNWNLLEGYAWYERLHQTVV